METDAKASMVALPIAVWQRLRVPTVSPAGLGVFLAAVAFPDPAGLHAHRHRHARVLARAFGGHPHVEGAGGIIALHDGALRGAIALAGHRRVDLAASHGEPFVSAV